MQALTAKKSTLPGPLTTSVFGDRGSQFVGRLAWDLCVTPEGYEIDEYDDDHSDYLIVHDGGDHLGSCRVRPANVPTMLTDHFLSSFPEAAQFLAMQRGRVYELTRFCRSPEISVAQSRAMLGQLAHLLDGYRAERRLAGFAAVVFPQVARFLDTIGVHYLLLSKSRIDGKTAYLICITEAVNPKLCPPQAAPLPRIPRLERVA